MVLVSERAREDSQRHARAQALVDTIRATSQQIDAMRAQALLNLMAAGAKRVHLPPGVIANGYGSSAELSDAVAQLRGLERDAVTVRLQADVGALYRKGLHTLAVADDQPMSQALHDEATYFRPVLDRLNADAARASAYERRVAARASTDADRAFVISLAAGLLALLLIGAWFTWERRRTERKKLEDELRHQAFHDSLTGLANRSLFEARVTQTLAIANRRGRSFAVLFVDLDDFKTINDSLGHGRGDDLLRAVGQRIRGIISPTDTAARVGGDEFALLIEVGNESEAHAVARRIQDTLAIPFSIGGRDLRVTASMGVAVWGGSSQVEDLLRNADMAMYAAKADGKASIRAFEPIMHRRLLDRLELTGELREAIERREFELEYQPIVQLEGGAIVGMEALVRWQHPERARVAPDQFIGIAEETGLIVPLGMWILETACAQGSEWIERYPGQPLQLSVNVSTRQLHDPTFVSSVRTVLAVTGLPPASLALELTESMLLGDQNEIVERLEALKALGVRVAVDDFGTGYSSLSLLRHFPLDILKIDRSFVDGIEHDAGKAKLVHGIVNLGDSLLLDVIAEGIERPGQADELRGMRAPLAQGFLFCRPLPPEKIEPLLEAGCVPLAESRHTHVA